MLSEMLLIIKVPYLPPQIRVPAFLDLFMQSLFKPGSKINQDHKHKYIHILAYAASVVETWKKVQRAGSLVHIFDLKSESETCLHTYVCVLLLAGEAVCSSCLAVF